MAYSAFMELVRERKIPDDVKAHASGSAPSLSPVSTATSQQPPPQAPAQRPRTEAQQSSARASYAARPEQLTQQTNRLNSKIKEIDTAISAIMPFYGGDKFAEYHLPELHRQRRELEAQRDSLQTITRPEADAKIADAKAEAQPAKDAYWSAFKKVFLGINPAQSSGLYNADSTDMMREAFEAGGQDYQAREREKKVEDAAYKEAAIGRDTSLSAKFAGTTAGAVQSTGGSLVNAGSMLLQGEEGFAKNVQRAKTRIGENEKRIAELQGNPQFAPLVAELQAENNFLSEYIESQRGRNDREQVQEKADELSSLAADSTFAAKAGSGRGGRFVVDAGVAGTQMAGDMALGAINPALGLGSMGVRVFGSATQEARQSGATHEQQLLYGLASALTAIGTEKIANLNPALQKAFGKSLMGKSLNETVTNAINASLKSPAAQKTANTLASMIMSGASEGAEEVLESFFNTLFEKAIYNPDAKFDVGEMAREGGLGALLGLGSGASAVTTPRAPAADILLGRTTPSAETTGPLKPFTQKEIENLSTGTRNKLVQLGTDIKSFVRLAMTNKNSNDRLYLGKIPDNVAAVASEAAGIDLTDFNIILPSNAVRHIFNHHGDQKTETPRGQIAIDENSIAMLPDVIAHPDNVYKSPTPDNLGREALVFEKDINGRMVAIQAISEGRKSLIADTLYIINNARERNAIPNDGMTVPAGNVRNALHATPSADSTIPQNNGGVNIQSAPKNLYDVVMGGIGKDSNPQSSVPSDFEAMGAMSPAFPYIEAPTQTRSINSLFTNAERLAHPELGDPTHKLYSNAESMRDAMERLEFDYEAEMDSLLNDSSPWGAAETVMARNILADLTDEARRTGDYSEVVKWAKKYQAEGTTEGQALQARKQFVDDPAIIVADAARFLDSDMARKMSKEKKADILKNMADQADILNAIPDGDTSSLIGIIKRNSEIRRTTGLFSKETSKAMDWVLKTYAEKFDGSEAFLREVATAQIRNMASDYRKISKLEAVKNYRIMGMLSKASTVLRNLGSNNVHDPLESLSNDLVVPLDILLSQITGTRSVAIDKSWFSSAKRKGSAEGALKSFMEVGLDADVSNAQSRYEQGSGRLFKMTGGPLERLLSTWAKYEGYALQTTDEFQKGGIKAEAQRGVDLLKERGLMAEDALPGRADEVARQRTFQNDSVAAKIMLGARDTLNKASLTDKLGGSLGVGDVGVPFAKVPGNIATQAANYSPAGLANGIKNIGRVLWQAHNGTLTPEMQAKAVTDVGRGITGTAGLVMLTSLAINGILTVAGSDDRNREAMERGEGATGTQLNISALLRWTNGEDAQRRTGDNVMSIGYLEPMNAWFAAAAMLADEYREDGNMSLGDIAGASVSSIVQAVLDLPAMSQLNDLVNAFRYSGGENLAERAVGAGASYAASQAKSFIIPNFVSGIAAGTDNTIRSTQAETVGQSVWNQIKAGTPGLRQTLPAMLDSFGRERVRAENPMLNFLNQNILPGQITKYTQGEVGAELKRLSDATGSHSMYPDAYAPRNITFSDGKHVLSLDEQRQYQRTRGQLNEKLVSETLADPSYKTLTAEQQNKVLSDIKGYSNDTAKRELADSLDKEHSNNYDKYYDIPDVPAYLIAKTAFDAARDSNGANGAAFEKAMGNYDNLSEAAKEALSGSTGFGRALQAVQSGVPLTRYYDYKDAFGVVTTAKGGDPAANEAFDELAAAFTAMSKDERESLSSLFRNEGDKSSQFDKLMDAASVGVGAETYFKYHEAANRDRPNLKYDQKREAFSRELMDDRSLTAKQKRKLEDILISDFSGHESPHDSDFSSKNNLEVSFLTENQQGLYRQYGEPSGMSAQDARKVLDFKTNTESDKDANGDTIDNSLKNKVMAYIDSLPITWEQKNAAYYMAGYKESKIYEAPWR